MCYTASTVKYLIIASFIVAVMFARPVDAGSTFDMNRIITDDDMTDTTMSAGRVQEFLNLREGILKSYSANVDGVSKTAAEIIASAAQAYLINPRVLLATIQKESSMLTRTSFATDSYRGSQQYYLDWIMFYSWCDSCTTGDNQYKGFANQINAAAGAFRRYLNQIADPNRGYTVSGWGPGITKSVQCLASDASRGLCETGATVTITPTNAATAGLYTYTPHPGGNYSFWKIWNDNNFDLTRRYPDGSLLRAEKSKDIWLISNGQKRKFANLAAFYSRYRTGQIISVSADHLVNYETGKNISFANYSLLMSPAGGVYLLVDDVIRPIKSRLAFRKAGFRREEVTKVLWPDLVQFSEGEEITPDNIYPSGILLQDKKRGGVWFVQNGVRQAVISRTIYQSQFGKRKPIAVSSAELAKYPTGSPVPFKDGDLIVDKAGGPIYVISDGQRRPIANQTTFQAYRFDFKNVIRADSASVAVMPLGPGLDAETSVALASQ